MSGLFRREALAQKQARRFGSPLALSPLSFKVFTVFVVLVMGAIGGLLYWGSYTNKQTVTGYILPSKGLITLYAPQVGTVVARYSRLGEKEENGFDFSERGGGIFWIEFPTWGTARTKCPGELPRLASPADAGDRKPAVGTIDATTRSV